MHHVHYKSAPQYLSDSVQSVATASCNRRTGLRSADTASYDSQTMYRGWPKVCHNMAVAHNIELHVTITFA